MSARIIFDRERCKECELCMQVCPKKLLQPDEHFVNHKGYHPIMITDQSACVACAACAKMCPDSVITVMKED